MNEERSEKKCREMLRQRFGLLSTKVDEGQYFKPGGFQQYKNDFFNEVEKPYEAANNLGPKKKTVFQEFCDETKREKLMINQYDRKLTEDQKQRNVEREERVNDIRRLELALQKREEEWKNREILLTKNQTLLDALRNEFETTRANLYTKLDDGDKRADADKENLQKRIQEITTKLETVEQCRQSLGTSLNELKLFSEDNQEEFRNEIAEMKMAMEQKEKKLKEFETQSIQAQKDFEALAETVQGLQDVELNDLKKQITETKDKYDELEIDTIRAKLKSIENEQNKSIINRLLDRLIPARRRKESREAGK